MSRSSSPAAPDLMSESSSPELDSRMPITMDLLRKQADEKRLEEERVKQEAEALELARQVAAAAVLANGGTAAAASRCRVLTSPLDAQRAAIQDPITSPPVPRA